MAFCRYCGRKLEEGETCTCQNQAGAPGSSVKAEVVLDQGKQAVGAAWKEFVHLLKAPVSYGESYVRKGNWVTSLIFLVLQGICSGLFAVFFVGKINGLIGLGGSMTGDLKFSGVGAFFLTLLYSLILSAVLAGLYLAGAKLLKGQARFQEALSIVSMRSVILIPVTLVSCLVFLISISAGIVCYYCMGALAAVTFLMAGSRGIAEVNPDRRIYLTVGVLFVFVVVFFLFASWVLPSYVPSSLRDISSLGGIMNSFMP